MLQREPVVVVPPELVAFDGRELTMYAEWVAAFDSWCDARAAWESEHPNVVLPEQILSDCPSELDLPHGGVWSRPQPDDGGGSRCAEHDLTADQHEVLLWR